MKMIKSKYFFMVIVSFIALVLSLIEYSVLAFATKYSYIPMLLSIIILIVLFIYAFVFKKKQSKYNLLILFFIAIWAVTLFYMGISDVVVGDYWINVSQDRISMIEFKFPGILEEIQYTYNSTSETIGSIVRKQFKGIDLNLLASIIMFFLSSIVVILKFKQEETQEVKKLEPSNKLSKSPYFLMCLISLVGIILSSVECIFLTVSANVALVMMVIGTIIFISFFIYILISNKKNVHYNFLVISFILLWALYAGKFLTLCMTQTNNGYVYHRLGFVFPCIITTSSFEYPSNIKISTQFAYGYINWLFSVLMFVVSFVILFFKEKQIFKQTIQK